MVNGFRDKPTGTLRLNASMSAARLVLPSIVPRFLAAYPEIRLEVVADETFVDVLGAGCDAGIRYEERLEQDMIPVPIGPRVQRMAAAAYLARCGALDLALDAAVQGLGIIYLFEDWLAPYFERGLLQPVLHPWWPQFSGPFLYYPGHRLVPAPLRAFVDFIRNEGVTGTDSSHN